MTRAGRRRVGSPILSVIGAGAIVASLLAGCTDASHLSQDAAEVTEAYVEPTALGEYELCAFATDAVREIVAELWSAPDEEALVGQTVTTYTKYAKRLRELAAQADTQQRRGRIEAAAAAAQAYANEVDRRSTYEGVDIDPAIEASKDAFPGCDLER